MTDKSLIKMIGITKRFPGVVANDEVDFDLRAGEIHSLLGENGAGKTTLMNILTGMCQADEGTVMVNGQTVKIRSPRDSLKLGIGMVYQHFTLIPNLTVLENLLLGFEGGIFLNSKKAHQKIQQISEAYGLSIDYRRLIQDLPVGERQRTEILKILYRESDILVLDEPTSVLSSIEAANLYHTLKLLRDAGKSVILITHHLNEALAVSDRVTIMRSGKRIASISGAEISEMGSKTATDKILDLMFKAMPRSVSYDVEPGPSNEPLLELNDIEALNHRGQIGLKHISFSISRGDIVGIAGADGEDQRLLAEIIGGQKRVYAGKLIYRGRDITRLGIAERFKLGIRYIPADRLAEASVADMALFENAVLQNFHQAPFSRFGIMNQPQIASFTSGLISRFSIRANGPAAPVNTLSGGNIQKLILARSLAGEPDLIVCNSPTYGLDAKTVCFIQDLLKKESRRGAAVLLITADMDELFSCSSRIGVLFQGQIIGLMDRCEATAEKIGKLMLGVK